MQPHFLLLKTTQKKYYINTFIKLIKVLNKSNFFIGLQLLSRNIETCKNISIFKQEIYQICMSFFIFIFRYRQIIFTIILLTMGKIS